MFLIKKKKLKITFVNKLIDKAGTFFRKSI